MSKLSRVAKAALLLIPWMGIALQPRPSLAQVVARPPAIQQAQSLIQQQRFDEAITLLRGFVKAQPTVPAAWVMLGVSLHAKGDHAAALEANERAVALNPSAVVALYNGGLEHALLGRPDEAFAWLGRAKADGRLDMTKLWVDPDAVSSAPTWGPNGSQAGKIYLYSSRTGALLWSRTGQPGEQFGMGIEAAGDVNGDGTPDVVAGAPLVGAGRAVVLSGRDGAQLLELKGEVAGERFGRRVSDVGDVNGDGRDDLLVTAPYHGGGGGVEGRSCRRVLRRGWRPAPDRDG